jgi:hypothetical protein
MTDVFDAQDALAAVFTGIDGLTATVGPVDNVTAAPAAIVVDTGAGEFLNYLVTMGGDAIDCQLTITVFVQAANLAAARELLRPYLADQGDRSVRALVAADPTLGGIVTDAVVTNASNLGRYTMGDTERRYLGVEFPVAVML